MEADFGPEPGNTKALYGHCEARSNAVIPTRMDGPASVKESPGPD